MTNFNRVDVDVCVIAHSTDTLCAVCIIACKSIVVTYGRTLKDLMVQTKVGGVKWDNYRDKCEMI